MRCRPLPSRCMPRSTIRRDGRTTRAKRQLHPLRRTIRYWASRIVVAVLTRAGCASEFDGRERLPPGAGDLLLQPPVLGRPVRAHGHAAVPPAPVLLRAEGGGHGRRRPEPADALDGRAIPYKPGKNDLLEATRRVGAVIAAGGVVAIAGEGRIGAIECGLLPLNDGPAYFALRSRRAARARSRSTGRAGCASAAASGSGSASRSRRKGGRTARPWPR